MRQWVLFWVMSAPRPAKADRPPWGSSKVAKPHLLERLPIPLRLLLAAQPKLVTPVLQVVHRVITRHLLGQAGLKPDEADSGAVTLIQRFGSAANLSCTHLTARKAPTWRCYCGD